MDGSAVRLALDTVIWDLDGTLYEDNCVYDRYAHELSRLLPATRRAAFLADWAAAKEGHCAACIGLTYDEAHDRLCRYEGDRLVCFVDWDGRVHPPALGGRSTTTDPLERAQTDGAPVGAPSAGEERIDIGDMWGLPDVLAAHHGLSRAQRGTAFMATRAFMSSDAWQAQPEPGLRDLLRALSAAGKNLVAMTNSPATTTHEVLDRLGLRDCFALVAPGSMKPAGLTQFLNQAGAPRRVLSIGDHYVNDIAPALRAGAQALYIDRHHTGLGAGLARCHQVRSIQAAIGWMSENHG